MAVGGHHSTEITEKAVVDSMPRAILFENDMNHVNDLNCPTCNGIWKGF